MEDESIINKLLELGINDRGVIVMTQCTDDKNLSVTYESSMIGIAPGPWPDE